MDLDAFATVNGARWTRLEALLKQRRLDGAESDELVRIYQAVATDLSTLRSAAPDPVLISRLSDLLARARARIAGAQEPSWRYVTRFFALSLPAALYRIRWWTFGVMVAMVAVALVTGLWIAAHPEALTARMSAAELNQYVNHDFMAYYETNGNFAARVWTNNALLCAESIPLGITGIGLVFVLFQNAFSIGVTAAMMGHAGKLDVFFQGIAPHGMLELTCVFVAGAAGLRIFWTIVDPGPRPRSRALAEEGRALFTVAIGLALALAVSGLVEGFVTGSGLAWWVKFAIGFVAFSGFWFYTFWWGGRAARSGETGDLAADEAGYVAPVVG